jgi:hypothetical protein
MLPLPLALSSLFPFLHWPGYFVILYYVQKSGMKRLISSGPCYADNHETLKYTNVTLRMNNIKIAIQNRNTRCTKFDFLQIQVDRLTL